MKRILLNSVKILFLSSVVVFFTGCLKDKDLVTDGVRTGGLVEVPAILNYKLGFTPTLDIDVKAQGPAITKILVYKQYFHLDDTTESEKVLLTTLEVGGANVTTAYKHTLSLTWADLIKDMVLPKYTIPTDEAFAAIGDNFRITYVSVMQSDDKQIINSATTSIAIANLFAGTYDVELMYFHPTAGGSYPTEPYGGVRKLKLDLIPKSPYDCETYFAIWTTNLTNINIDAANKVTITFDKPEAVSGDPNDPTKVNSYDPVTGVINIYYYYPGAGGNRIFWEKFTPKK